MKKSDVEKAIDAAKEFIKRGQAVLDEDYKYLAFSGTRKTGALRRQSMELSQALVAIRRPTR